MLTYTFQFMPTREGNALCVVAGADLRLSLASRAPRLFSRDSAVLIKGVPSLAHQPAHSPQRKEHCAAPFTNPRGLRVQCSYLLCRYEKAQGVNLGLEFFVSTIKAMATISDLHEIYAFQFGFARLTSKFVAFCCERDRVTEISAPLSSRLKLLRIASQ